MCVCVFSQLVLKSRGKARLEVTTGYQDHYSEKRGEQCASHWLRELERAKVLVWPPGKVLLCVTEEG